MDKIFEDDEEFKKFLEDEYIKEAEMLEKKLLSEEDAEDTELSDEYIQASYEKLRQKLIKDGAYRFDLPIRRNDNIRLVRRYYPLSKTAAIVFISALCVLAASLSSGTNRTEMVQRFEYILGNE